MTGRTSYGHAVPLLLAALLAAGCAKPPSEPALAERRAAVSELLAYADDRGAISELVGVTPERCVEVSPDAMLCQWRVGNRQSGWESLAGALGTRDQVNLLCKLPQGGGPRGPDSCVGFPRRSNRGLYTLPTSSNAREARQTAQEKARVEAGYRRAANQALDAARNAVELSHVVGAAPERCAAIDASHRGCVWKANAATYGHGTLVQSIGVSDRKRVRLECRLPLDGSRRAAGSCTVEVGA